MSIRAQYPSSHLAIDPFFPSSDCVSIHVQVDIVGGAPASSQLHLKVDWSVKTTTITPGPRSHGDMLRARGLGPS